MSTPTLIISFVIKYSHVNVILKQMNGKINDLHWRRKYKFSGPFFNCTSRKKSYVHMTEWGGTGWTGRDTKARNTGRDGTWKLGTRDGMGLSKKNEAGWDGTGRLFGRRAELWVRVWKFCIDRIRIQGNIWCI
jgi:hypothetical protein